MTSRRALFTGTVAASRRNHGLPRLDGYGKGNLVIQVQVEVPQKITPEQEELLVRFDSLDEEHLQRKKKKGIFEKVKDIFH